MKKNILVFILVIVLGISSGRFLYYKIGTVYAKSNISNVVYLLQLGVYSNKESLNTDTKNITNKIIVKDNNNYYVYVGVSTNKDNLKKISNIYKKYGYNLYLREEYINDEELLNNIKHFDSLLKDTKSIDEINSINSVILSIYEEKIKK